MDAFTRLVTFYNNCEVNDTYRTVAGNILQNIHALPKSSSYQMADICFTAPSTIRRLATKIGYKSYTAFKADLNFSLENYRFLNVYRPLNTTTQADNVEVFLSYISDMALSLNKAIDRENLDKIVSVLRKYEKIVLFVSIPSHQIQRLETDLLLDGHEVILYTNLHDQVSQVELLDHHCFAIFIKPEVPAIANIRELTQRAKAHGATTLVISNNNSYFQNDFIDYVLEFNGAASLIDVFAIDMLVASLITKHQEHIHLSDKSDSVAKG